MRIALLAIGSRGDVQPYTALALGLKNAGHDVRMLCPARFKDFIESYRLTFCPLNWDPGTFMGGPVTESGRSLFGFWRNFFPKDKRVSENLLRECIGHCEGAEILLANFVAFFGPMLGKYLGIPTFLMSAVPGFETRELPQFFFPPLPEWMPMRGAYNRLSYFLFNAVACGFLSKEMIGLRKRVLSLPPLKGFLKDSLLYGLTVPMLHEFSPSVIPEPADWKEMFRVSGYWFLDHRPGWKPTRELVRFLSDGKPPVFISFGSVPQKDPRTYVDLVFEGVARSGERAILAGGWSRLSDLRSPENVLIVNEVPHDWLFPQTAGIVHHGGAGVTAAAFRAGIPSVAVPHFGDQFFWGERIFALGAGPRPIPRKKLSAQKLADAIVHLISDEQLRKAAEGLGAKIRAEDGVGEAVRWVERWANDGRVKREKMEIKANRVDG